MENLDILNYCIKHSSQTSDVAQELAQYTRDHVHGSEMLIGELEAAVIGFLIKIGGCKRVLEFGTFTGYSALTMAENLPEDGTVTTIDINPQTSSIAKEFWLKSTHGHKITQKMGAGLEVMESINERFDLIFIDADKNNYLNYLKWSLNHLTQQGFIVTDNTLWSGKVLNNNSSDKRTKSIIEHNLFASQLEHYQKVLLPIRDGMFLIKPL